MKRALIFVSIVGALFILGAAVANAHSRHRVSFPQRHIDRVTYKDLRHKPTITVKPTTTTVKATTSTTRPTTTTAPTTTTTAGSQWQLEFSEDFNTDAAEGAFLDKYPSMSAYDTGWPDTTGGGRYRTDNLSASNGHMLVHCTTKDGYPGCAVPYFKGLNGQGMLDQTYGQFNIKLHADPVVGYKVAILLWSAADNWNDGEIDFPEGSLDGTASAFNHYPGNPTSQDGFDTKARLTDEHTYTVDWTPQAVTFFVDGVQVGRSTHVPTRPMHPVAQVETDTGTDMPSSTADGYVYVDNMSAWAYKG